jgi:hypothetical protein
VLFRSSRHLDLRFPAYDCIVSPRSNLPSIGDIAGLLLRMPHTEFQNGYVAGWQSIRADEQPPDFPVFQVPEGETPYRAGIALGVRDAIASIAKKRGSDRWIDDWLDHALRRR